MRKDGFLPITLWGCLTIATAVAVAQPSIFSQGNAVIIEGAHTAASRELFLRKPPPLHRPSCFHFHSAVRHFSFPVSVFFAPARMPPVVFMMTSVPHAHIHKQEKKLLSRLKVARLYTSPWT